MHHNDIDTGSPEVNFGWKIVLGVAAIASGIISLLDTVEQLLRIVALITTIASTSSIIIVNWDKVKKFFKG